MPLSAAAVVKPLPRALSIAAAAAATATTSLLIITVVVSRARSSHDPSSPPPSTSASTTAALPPASSPSPLPDADDPPPHPQPPPPPVPPCPPNASHLVPCHEPPSGERHCPPHPPPPPPHPPKDPPPHPPHPPHPPPPPPCRVPPPPGYRPPPPWPARLDRVRFANTELPLLPSAKTDIALDPSDSRKQWLVFPNGVGTYVEQLERMLPLRGGAVRTALDVGCGVASFGNHLLSYGILTMSIAPRDRNEAQVQFALERGLPAMIGVLGAHRLPYPSRAFDMVHSAGCLAPWTAHDGRYMLEIDRLLRPGGYWVFSRPPINWKSLNSCLNQTVTVRSKNQTVTDLEGEQVAMEDMAKKLCWTKVAEKGTITVWQKPKNHLQCAQEAKVLRSPPCCTGHDPDSAWYTDISMCIICLPRVEQLSDIAGGAVDKWPQRLTAVPPRLANGEMKGMSNQTYKVENLIWKKRVDFYGTFVKDFSLGSYRNVMDMNAGVGGFAAAMSKYPVWVMNVVPANISDNTLAIIYERGLIGTYMDWCEAFSTYPRTYDMIHANGVLSLYIDKCSILGILLEMDRILRPGGAAIIRDRADILLKAKEAADRIQWNSRIADTENGALDPEKLLIIDNSLPLPGN